MENHRILFLPNFLISLLVCILVRIARVIWLAIISKSKILDFRGSRQINLPVRTVRCGESSRSISSPGFSREHVPVSNFPPLYPR